MFSQTSKSSYGKTGRHLPAWLVPGTVLALVTIPAAAWGPAALDSVINAPRFDANWCLAEKPADNVVFLLEDLTDPFSPRHRQAVHPTYNRFAEPPPGIAARGRIVMLTMDAESKGMARQIDSF